MADQLKNWDELTDEEQDRLLDAFGFYLDQLPPTCSMESKVARFRHWLRENGVNYVSPAE